MISKLWDSILYPLLSSKASTTVVGILAAGLAFYVYFMRRRDNKKDAANIVLLEVRNAERNLDEARKVYEEAKQRNPATISFPEKLRLMPTDSWSRYKYLFVRDFSPEEWDNVSKFYSYCRNFDDAVELKDSSFFADATEIRTNIHRVVADAACALAAKTTAVGTDAEKQTLVANAVTLKNATVDHLLKDLIHTYTPDKAYYDAGYFFNLLPHSIINTPTGKKLEQLADRKIQFFRRKAGA